MSKYTREELAKKPRGFYKVGPVWYFGKTDNGKDVRVTTGHRNLDDAIGWVYSRPDLFMREKHKPVVQINPFQCEPFEFTDKWIQDAARNTSYKSKGEGLSEEAVRKLVARANGRCELTGIPFTGDKPVRSTRRPFIPSIDRVRAGLPYSIDNCRLVCFSVNVALNEWGDDVFDMVCLGRLTYKLAAMVPHSLVARNSNPLKENTKVDELQAVTVSHRESETG